MQILRKTMALAIIICLVTAIFPTVSLAASPAADFSYYLDGEEVVIHGYRGKGGNVVIPTEIEGKSVTRIGNYAFWGSTVIKSLTIPASVTEIGSGAFAGCIGLTNIELPSGITNISTGAFSGCSSLANVTIPSGVTVIGDGAFEGCTSLASIAIPSGVARLGQAAFSWCTSLTSLAIPSGVTRIEDGLFYGCIKLSGITIPSGVTSIGEAAFLYCRSLTNITIPSKVMNIDDYAFNGCAKLTSINVSSENSKYASASGILYNKTKTQLICCPGGKSGAITVPSGVTKIGVSAFEECEKVTSIKLPSSLKSIGYDAFCGCGITSMTIPSGVTIIADWVFAGCKKLTKISIPDTVTSIGESTFYECASLTNIDVSSANTKYASGSGILYNKAKTTLITCPDGKSGSITIPSGVKKIADWAFDDCAKLTGITIPSTVTSVGDCAFFNCYVLKGAYFLGNAPSSFGEEVFATEKDDGLTKIYYLAEKSGWTTPIWKGYITEAISKPAKPTVAAASTGYTSNKITWKKVSGASGYEIYRATSSSGSYLKIATVASGSTLSYADKSLTTNKTYYYKVRAYRNFGIKTLYSSHSAVQSAKPVPAKPASVKASRVSSSSIKVSWEKVSGASGYEVYRATKKTGTYAKVTTIKKGSTVSYTNKSLAKGKTYYYKVRAYRTVNGKEVYGSFSSIKSAKT